MRDSIRSVSQVPEHMGLAYDVWAKTDELTGGIPLDARPQWFESLANIPVPLDYAKAFELWQSSLDGARLKVLTLDSRLLVGHGNPSPLEAGLTVHHTWGVPVIPGSALKGLLSHYLDAAYGPLEPISQDRSPMDPGLTEKERERARYQGSTWDDKGRVHHGPGEIHRALFGAPDARTDEALHAIGAECGETMGAILFHDALYVPSGFREDRPYVWDVLTVHQSEYYRRKTPMPSDYDDPNPVHFLTVRPGSKFLIALSAIGSDAASVAWTEQTMEWLCDALSEWGVGAKTSAGYGHFTRPPRAVRKPVQVFAGATLYWNAGRGGVLEAKLGHQLVGVLRGDPAKTMLESLGPDAASRLLRRGQLAGVQVVVEEPNTRAATIVRVERMN